VVCVIFWIILLASFYIHRMGKKKKEKTIDKDTTQSASR